MHDYSSTVSNIAMFVSFFVADFAISTILATNFFNGCFGYRTSGATNLGCSLTP